MKEKSEDNIPFVGFEYHTYPFMGDYFPFVVDYFSFVGDYFPFMGDYFPFMGDYFPLKGKNSPLIGITFGRNFSLPTDPFVGEYFPLKGITFGHDSFSLYRIRWWDKIYPIK